MLALFKEEVQTQLAIDPHHWARLQWRSGLDKGKVLTLMELSQLWLKDFPESPTPDFSYWHEALMPAWLLTGIASDTREVFCHGPELIEALGNTRTTISSQIPAEDWQLWVETFATLIGLEFNFTHPSGSALYQVNNTAWRITLLHGSLTPSGVPKVFCRQLAAKHRQLSEFDIPIEVSELLTNLMRQQANILIAGSTGSGKTTFMSSLLTCADTQEHIVMLEDTQEITSTHARLTRMLATDKPGRSLKDYLTYSLRLSPDRIVLGEMRSNEVVPYILAMNTGHKGLLSTLHASSAPDTLLRVAQLFVLASGNQEISYQEVLKLVCRNVGYVVFLQKRKITEIIRVFGCDGDMPMYDVVWRAPA